MLNRTKDDVDGREIGLLVVGFVPASRHYNTLNGIVIRNYSCREQELDTIMVFIRRVVSPRQRMGREKREY